MVPPISARDDTIKSRMQALMINFQMIKYIDVNNKKDIYYKTQKSL